MNKWALIVDVPKCSNCNNCTMAVKDEYVGNDFPGYSASQPNHGHEWITIDRHIRGNGSMVDVTYVPRTCNHCDNAPCIEAGGGAISKRQDGIVIIDPITAKGMKNLVSACPYGAIWWNEELQLPQHWTFDAHLLDGGWKEPRCVQVCPTGALESVKIDDEALAARVKGESLSVLRPELGAKPRVYYRGLERTRTCFLGGNVSTRSADHIVDNVEGATVELSIANSNRRIQATTDRYGDFKIDALEGNGSQFTLQASHPRFGVGRMSGVLNESLYVGTVELGAP